MNLRSRLFFAMVACGLLPVLGAGLLARDALTRRDADRETRRREDALGRVERTLDARARTQRRALARFCAHDYLVDRTLLQLESGQFTTSAQEELSALLPEVREAIGLDTLSLVRDDGVVLASAHYPGQMGRRDAETFHAAERATGDAPQVRQVRVRAPEGPRDRLVLESGCVRRRGHVAVAVAGGEAVDADWLAGLAGQPGVRVSLEMGRDPRGVTGLRRALPLRDADGAVVATVVVESTDTDLDQLIRQLDRLTLLAMLVAVGVALVVAALLAAPLARPIGVVADAADRVARGDRAVSLSLRASGEVGRLVTAFNHMVRELTAAETRVRRAERLSAWRDIARQMAHEIKNPLTPIRMGVEMLQRARERRLPEFDELFTEQTRIVLDEVERLRRLVEDFSGFARMPRPKPAPLSVMEVVRHVVELHARGDVAVTSTLEGAGADAVPPLRADRDQLTQVLVNLVANGCHAAAERAANDPSRGEARVTVRVTPTPTHARVVVEDNGGGIPAEVLERLFEPYVTTKRGGNGLGLAIVHRIVTEHGGTITPETSPQGTRFVVELPWKGPVVTELGTRPDDDAPLLRR